MRKIWDLFRTTFKEWNNDRAAQLSAALAYYTIFSMAPILIIVLAIAGRFFNQQAARDQLMSQMSGFMGAETARFVGTIIESSGRSSSGLLASILSFIILLIGATGFFGQVQSSLNQIWQAPPPPGGIKEMLKNRLRSFFIVIGMGLLLLIFLIASALLSILNGYTNGSSQLAQIFAIVNFVVLFGLMTVMFAMIFRIVPDKNIRWRDVWLGAALTSLLFVIGRFAISLYLSYTKSGSTYGAAGSLIVLLIWIYYSAQIFLLGAEFTQVYARMFGSRQGDVKQPENQENRSPTNQTALNSR